VYDAFTDSFGPCWQAANRDPGLAVDYAVITSATVSGCSKKPVGPGVPSHSIESFSQRTE
jgi:hypothetical protein